MEITIKVAIEDLEKSIENKSTKKLDDLSNNQEHINSEKLILEYFRNNLTFSLLDNTKEFEWVGKETSNNLHDIYLYFEIPNFDKNENIESITIKNTLFLDLYDYQTNIVLVELPERKYNLTFTIDKDIQTIFMNKSSK
tara:strand:- start:524 stop:940 length:417 start_codon:yes stop_codon:yes gene_type:complete